MPFTTSHPAIILPLKWLWPRYFSLTGLVAGAMSPDLLYFLAMNTPNRGFSHSWPGLFIFCIPAGLAFALAFQWLIKRPLLQSLPAPADSFFSGLSMASFRPTTRRDWTVLLGSVVVGALSHFFWDSWTHETGVVASHLPILLKHTTIFGRGLYGYEIAQHVSTIVGGLVFFGYLLTGRLTPPPRQNYQPIPSGRKVGFWFIVGLGAVGGVMLANTIWCGSPGFGAIDGCPGGQWLRASGLGSWAGVFWTICLYRIGSLIATERSLRAVAVGIIGK